MNIADLVAQTIKDLGDLPSGEDKFSRVSLEGYPELLIRDQDLASDGPLLLASLFPGAKTLADVVPRLRELEGTQFFDSYAQIMKDGSILRYGVMIGQRADLKPLDVPVSPR